MKYEFEVSQDDNGSRLDQFLCKHGEFVSRSRAQALIRDGHVSCNGKVLSKTGQTVSAGEQIVVDVPAETPSPLLIPQVPFAPHQRLDILYQDDEIIVLNKAAGVCVHAGAGNPHDTLVERVLGEGISLAALGLPVRPGVVHRLDKGTSGVMVLARTDAAYLDLVAQFSLKSVRKTYLAVIWGEPKQRSGTLKTQMGRHPGNRQKFASVARQGKEAITHFRVLGSKRPFTFVEVTIETGRTHQIRVHFSEMGHAIVGDTLYGGGKKRAAAFTLPPEIHAAMDALDHPLLLARALSFQHPKTHDVLSFSTPLPDEFLPFIDRTWLVSYETTGRSRES